jgi:hypothetical protein
MPAVSAADEGRPKVEARQGQCRITPEDGPQAEAQPEPDDAAPPNGRADFVPGGYGEGMSPAVMLRTGCTSPPIAGRWRVSGREGREITILDRPGLDFPEHEHSRFIWIVLDATDREVGLVLLTETETDRPALCA